MAGSLFDGGGNRWRVAGWGLAGAILLVPLVAMAFTAEMNWGAEDFLAAAVLLGGFGLAFELAVRVTPNPIVRVVTGLALGALLLLVWAELAVGLLS